jgi:hypothetical protein
LASQVIVHRVTLGLITVVVGKLPESKIVLLLLLVLVLEGPGKIEDEKEDEEDRPPRFAAM